MEQGEKYFVAKITVDSVDYTPTDVEAKVTKIFEAYTQNWRITAISESKIDEVIE